MKYEEILVLRKRLDLVGRKEMVKILSFELKARQAIDRQQIDMERKIVDKIRERENGRPKS
jgi:hypothetical protein